MPRSKRRRQPQSAGDIYCPTCQRYFKANRSFLSHLGYPINALCKAAYEARLEEELEEANPPSEQEERKVKKKKAEEEEEEADQPPLPGFDFDDFNESFVAMDESFVASMDESFKKCSDNEKASESTENISENKGSAKGISAEFDQDLLKQRLDLLLAKLGEKKLSSEVYKEFIKFCC